MSTPLVEVCVEGLDGVQTAQASGADRIELCASLFEGGLTPSLGTIERALELARIPIFPIIRPRGGDFLYSAEEFASMLADVRSCRKAGAKGVVFGCLTESGEIDEDRMMALKAAAGDMSTTCHRAFDMTRNFDASIEALVRCGIDRVLTSGGCAVATDGLDTLREIVVKAGDRIKVMVCGDLDAGNIARVRRATGATEFHFAALQTVASPMKWRNPSVAMGGTKNAREYELTVTDGDAVAATIAAVRSSSG